MGRRARKEEVTRNLDLLQSPRYVIDRVWPRPEVAAAVRVAHPVPVTPDGRIADSYDEVYRVIIKSGCVDEFVGALAAHPDNAKDQRWLKLAASLASREGAGVPFSRLCTIHHINPIEIVPYFMDYQRSIGMFEIARSTPKILRELAEDAQRKEAVCGACGGRKFVWEPMLDGEGDPVCYEEGHPKAGRPRQKRLECQECGAAGRVQRDPDREDRELVLKIAGLVNDKPVNAVQVNINSSLEDTVTRVGEALTIERT